MQSEWNIFKILWRFLTNVPKRSTKLNKLQVGNTEDEKEISKSHPNADKVREKSFQIQNGEVVRADSHLNPKHIKQTEKKLSLIYFIF